MLNELAQELIDLQAVCERLGVDDDGVLYRAADSIVKLEAQLEQVNQLVSDNHCESEWCGKSPTPKNQGLCFYCEIKQALKDTDDD